MSVLRLLLLGGLGTAAAHQTYWYEAVEHNGISPFIPNGQNWTVYRNVRTDFGAKGDGVTDDSSAIQTALQYGNGTLLRENGNFGTTGQPAVVYLPGGTYLLKSPIQSYVDTVIMGDPLNPPVLKASADFTGNVLWNGKDPAYDSTINFYIALKNVVLDSTDVPPSQAFTLLDWSVSQAVQLTNVVFNMAVGAANHTGLFMPEGGSPLIMNDLVFQGGGVGIDMNEQQYHFKGITFKNMNIGLKLTKLFEGTGQGLHFEGCETGVDTTNNNTGFFALIDSSATFTNILFNTAGSNTAQGSIVLENIQVDFTVQSTVAVLGKSILRGPVYPGNTWIWGDVYSPKSPAQGERAEGKLFKSFRSPQLVDWQGAYYVSKPPTFQEWGVSGVINVKSVPGFPVGGNGMTDDTANIQSIITRAAAESKVVFFPHGTYLLSDTLYVPPGSRFHGEVWSEFSATGSKFKDAGNPIPMIRVGKPDEKGVAQFVDMLFTVADILPGCILVEVNMAGPTPGDVGFYNSHFRIGGADGSKVQTECGDPATCTAARICAHMTASSSAYWENSWCWSADHDLDNPNVPTPNPSTGGGFLIESTQGTWMLGIGSEHNDLYQMNIYKAENVFLAFQQSETPYWQGNGSDILTPEPWQDSLLPSDPDFSWCARTDAQCRMALFQRVADSKNVNVYGGGYWVFFNGLDRNGCADECQQNAVLYENSTELYSFGISTHNVRNLLLQDINGAFDSLVPDTDNSGGWQSFGGVMAAYLPALSEV